MEVKAFRVGPEVSQEGGEPGRPTMKWLAGQEQIRAVVAEIRGCSDEGGWRGELSHSTIRARGAWVDPSAGRNRSVEVSRGIEPQRLAAFHAFTAFGQLVSADLHRLATAGDFTAYAAESSGAAARLA